ncbi:MAG: hypothetical protein GXO43_10090 [Crenarchaeota archaeon]|nr:hypothetical protein [Thermoproteota archaeon]
MNRSIGIALIILGFTLALIYFIGLVIAPDMYVGGIKFSDLLVRAAVLVAVFGVSGFIIYVGYVLMSSTKEISKEEAVKEYKESQR